MKLEMEENIDRYLLGEMSETERIAFEQKIESDEQLRRQISIHTELLHAINETGKQEDEDIFEQLKRCDQQTAKKTFTKRERPVFKRFMIWSISAAAIFILAFGLKRHFDNQFYDSIYNRYYEPITEATPGRGAYDSQDYDQALKLWQEGYAKESISGLIEIVNEGDIHPYYEDACWNLALFYLKTHDKKKAIEMLLKIIDEQGYYTGKATEVLEDLR